MVEERNTKEHQSSGRMKKDYHREHKTSLGCTPAKIGKEMIFLTRSSIILQTTKLKNGKAKLSTTTAYLLQIPRTRMSLT